MSFNESGLRSLHRPVHDFDVAPLLVFYELTRACDLVCLHCRACAQRGPAPDELSGQAAHALIDQIAEFLPQPLLVFTGGDPFKRRDLVSLVEHATRQGLEVAVTPSATPLVTRAALDQLWHAGASRIAVSLDGPDAASHDHFRGVAGSFERTLEIIRDARGLGLPVQVNTTITPTNWRQIADFCELLEGLDIVLWSVFFLVPVGRAEKMQRLSAGQIEQTFRRLWSESQRRPFPIKTTEAPHYRRFVAQQIAAGKGLPPPTPRARYASLATNDGKGILFVAHNGEIYPSGFMPIAAGRFPQDSLVDSYRTSPLLRALRDPERLEGKCGYCEFRKRCGGSRARAYAVTGNPLAQEPDCAYRPRTTQSSTPTMGAT